MSEGKYETLKDIAKVHYKLSKEVFTSHENDEFLNIVAYHLDQAVEYYLKDLLEMSGVDYPHTHEIAELLAECKKAGVEPVLYEYLFSQSDTFTVWGSKTRYVKNYRAQRDKVAYAVERLAELFQTEERPAMDGERPTFQIVTGGEDVLKYIFPTKQRDVQKAIELAGQDPRIIKVVVFGSAVSLRCGTASDLDLTIFAPGVSEEDFLLIGRVFHKSLTSEVDVIHYEEIYGELIQHDIDRKGVVVYEQQI